MLTVRRRVFFCYGSQVRAATEAIEKIERALIGAGITFLAANAQGSGIRGQLKTLPNIKRSDYG